MTLLLTQMATRSYPAWHSRHEEAAGFGAGLRELARHTKAPARHSQTGASGEPYSRWPVAAGAIPAWVAASAPITGNWKVLPW